MGIQDEELPRQINSEKEFMKDWRLLAEAIIIYGMFLGIIGLSLLFIFSQQVLGIC